MENPSLCIPRVFNSVTRRQIRKVISEMQLGDIDYIDLHLGRDYQKVFVYFKNWYTTPFATSIRKRFLDGEELKIIYDDPWFWKCSLITDCGQREEGTEDPVVRKERMCPNIIQAINWLL